MASRHYFSRRPGNIPRRQATLELVVTAFVFVLVVVALVIFLFVYHDFPLRISGV